MEQDYGLKQSVPHYRLFHGYFATTSAQGGLAISNDGNIYVHGVTGTQVSNFENGYINIPNLFYGQSHNGGIDVYVAQYDSEGNRNWETILGSSSNDYAKKIITGNDGSIYITGETWGGANYWGGEYQSNYDDIYLAKLNSSGVVEWKQLIGSSGSDYEEELIIGEDNAIYLVGHAGGEIKGLDDKSGGKFITKFSANGTQEWIKSYGEFNLSNLRSGPGNIGIDTDFFPSGIPFNSVDSYSHLLKLGSYLENIEKDLNTFRLQNFNKNQSYLTDLETNYVLYL